MVLNNVTEGEIFIDTQGKNLLIKNSTLSMQLSGDNFVSIRIYANNTNNETVSITGSTLRASLIYIEAGGKIVI